MVCRWVFGQRMWGLCVSLPDVIGNLAVGLGFKPRKDFVVNVLSNRGLSDELTDVLDCPGDGLQVLWVS